MDRGRWRGWLFPVVLCAFAGCASKQKIPLDCIPKDVVVYVDGERLDELPPELDLRRDQPHTIFLKGPGFQPELIVLSSEEVAGKPTLTPGSVCVHPRLLEVRRELELEIDPDVSAGSPEHSSETGSTVEVAPPPEFLLDDF